MVLVALVVVPVLEVVVLLVTDSDVEDDVDVVVEVAVVSGQSCRMFKCWLARWPAGASTDGYSSQL